MPAGSAVVEAIIYLLTPWLLFIPGFMYSHWRTKNAIKICRACSGVMIPADSPRGHEILERISKK